MDTKLTTTAKARRSIKDEEPFRLSSIANAQYGSTDMFTLKPYDRQSPGYYGIIQFHQHSKFQACKVEINDIVKRALNKHYHPGGTNIEFIQQRSGDWLVAFKANSILASAYMRLRADEMKSLITQFLDDERKVTDDFSTRCWRGFEEENREKEAKLYQRKTI